MRGLVLACVIPLLGCQASEQLSTTAQEVIVVNPASHDFGTLQVGQASAPFTITIQPAAGASDDTITAITASCPDFSVSAPGLPAEVLRTCLSTCGSGSSTSAATPAICAAALPSACQTDQYVTYQLTATFQPTVAAMVSCVVSIAGTTNKTLTLTGTGTPPPIHLDVQPGSVGFGDVRRNTDSSPATVTVANLGGSTMTVSSVSISAGFAIAAGPTTSYTVGANASQPYALTCHPSALGAISGALVIASDDPTSPQTSIPLSCNGIDSNLDVTPSPAALATTRVGEPVQLTLMINNSGGAPSTLESVAVTGGVTLMSGPPANTVLAPGGTTAAVVAFAATTAGDASGNLIITYDGGQLRTTQLAARALATSLSLAPDGEVDFGPVCVGQTAAQHFTLVANSDGPFQLQQLTSGGGPFTVTPPALPVTLEGAAANLVRFDVIVAPTDVGSVAGTITLVTDVPGAAPHSVTVDVTGLPGGVTPTPVTVDFGSNPLDTTTIGQQVHLSNCLAAPITTTSPRIEGPDAAEFAIVASPGSAIIAPAGLASWLVVFQGHTVGLKQATFAVDFDGGTASVALDAEALGAQGPAADGPPSYYACKAGGAAGLAPIALALLAIRRRRRR